MSFEQISIIFTRPKGVIISLIFSASVAVTKLIFLYTFVKALITGIKYLNSIRNRIN